MNFRQSGHSRNIAFLIVAMLASANASHAATNLVMATEDNRADIEELVKSGDLIPTERKDWYEIDSERLREALAGLSSGDSQAEETVKKLKGIFGEDTFLKVVPIMQAKFGTQDWAN